MKKITAVLLGAGGRGMHSYAPYALKHPDEIQFIAVAEPDDGRRNKFKEQHGIADEMCFSDWEELMERPQLADAAFVCTQDNMHFEPTVRLLEKGYHILLEKPMSPDPNECIMIEEYAEKYNRVISVCHVLRYTGFFSKIKSMLENGRIGQLISIQHNENVGHIHQSHSFVRGNWGNSNESSPMILAKSCHDMDIMLWLAGANCVRLSSFGTLTHFKKESAPKNAPMRCLDGCPVEDRCQYHAAKIYLTDDIGWPASVISNDTSIEARTKALKDGPYGRCVYHCDNNVVDHQVVNIEFENEVTAAFTMCAFTNEMSRTIKLMGTKGEIRGFMEKNEIEVTDFETGTKEVIYLKVSQDGHSGGDYGIMKDFVKLLQKGNDKESITSAHVSVESHLMAFAAEKSRLEKRVIELKQYKEEFNGK